MLEPTATVENFLLIVIFFFKNLEILASLLKIDVLDQEEHLNLLGRMTLNNKKKKEVELEKSTPLKSQIHERQI